MTDRTDEFPDSSLWRHKGNGKVYIVLGHIRIELPDQTWVDMVRYREYVGGPSYGRTSDRFRERFERVA
jgi:hypothetical protein